MAIVTFTENIQRLIECPPMSVDGQSLHDVLENVFNNNPNARSYILDDQGQVRKHINIFINDQAAKDRKTLTDKIQSEDNIYIMQALSGG